MKGIAVSDEDINIAAGTAPATASGVAYRQVTVDGLRALLISMVSTMLKRCL